jgi:ribonucleoside-diphosphate reductase alpha chain
MANINFDEIGYYCDLSVRLLDNTIELTTPPIQEAANHNNRYRTIGVGVMGWADYLARNEKKYSDLEETSQVFEEIAYHCTNASMGLSKERGAFSAFERSEWSEGNLGAILPGVQLRLQEETNRWHQLKADIMRFGIRNSHIIAIAPNTSSSKLQGCTASILPTYQRFFYDKAGKGFDPISVAFPEYWWHYQENHRLEQIHVVNAVSTMQKWVDTGISMELTYNLNQGVYWADKPEKSITAKDVFETELTAWKKGCKSIYYTRTIQKDSFKESSECVSCAN